jgi:hypothetical protein
MVSFSRLSHFSDGKPVPTFLKMLYSAASIGVTVCFLEF